MRYGQPRDLIRDSDPDAAGTSAEAASGAVLDGTADAADTSEPAAEGATGEPKAATVADIGKLSKTIAELAEAVAEQDTTIKYWADKAEPAASEPAAKGSSGDDTDIVAVLNDKGASGLKAWMAEQGFVTAAEASKLAQDSLDAGVTQAQMLSQNPELSDSNSAIYKSTAAHFERLDGLPRKERIETAVRLAELDQLKKGAPAAGASEKDRRALIAAQSGGGSPAPGQGLDVGDAVTLSADELRAAKGMGVSAEKALAAKRGMRAPAGIAA